MIHPTKIIPGQLSLNSEMQLDKIAKKIFELFQNHKKEKELKTFNILSLTQRLRRSMESAKILNEKLNNYFNFSENKNFSIVVKPFNLSIYNTTEIKENDVIEKDSNNTIINYFIPKIYDNEIFPIHFRFK